MSRIKKYPRGMMFVSGVAALAAAALPTAAWAGVYNTSSFGHSSRALACSSAKSRASANVSTIYGARVTSYGPCECDSEINYKGDQEWSCSVDAYYSKRPSSYERYDRPRPAPRPTYTRPVPKPIPMPDMAPIFLPGSN
jgi:hypothetical protein